jgi:hypothetical protein
MIAVIIEDVAAIFAYVAEDVVAVWGDRCRAHWPGSGWLSTDQQG